MATDSELRAAGYVLPKNTDLISGGDDAIRANAAAAYDGIEAAKWYRGYLPEGADFNDYGTTALNGVWAISNSRAYVNNPLLPTQSGVLVVESAGYAAMQTVQAYADPTKVSRYQNSSTSKAWSAWTGENLYRGIVPDGADLNNYHSPEDSGIWRLANVRTYTNSPLANGVTGLFIVASNGYAATQEVQQYARADKYTRYQTNYSTHTWAGWSRGGTSDNTNSGSADDPARLIAPAESDLATVAFWGDSNTQKGGAVARLGELLPDSTVINLGRSGQSARQIAARQGGYPSLLTVEGNTIPASGTVTVTNTTVPLLIQTGYPGVSTKGTLAGVHGTLTVEAGTSNGYTFTRTTAGSAVACPPQTPFITDDGANNRDSVCVFWTGGNHPTDGVTEFNIDMAAHLTPAHKRFLVLSNITRSDEPQGTQGYTDNIIEIAQGKAAFGDRYIDIRAWMIANGLDELGITPTAEDQTAIDGDTIPPSLTSDGAHFTPAAQRLVGEQIYARMTALGWV